MNILIHILSGIAGSYLLRLNGNEQILFIAWSLLIDADHILFFLAKYHKEKIAEWPKIAKKLRKEMIAGLYIFHSPEFNLMLIIAMFLIAPLKIIFAASLLHISLDMVEHYSYHRNMGWMKRWSIIRAIMKNQI